MRNRTNIKPMYPVPIPVFKWKTPDHCQITCRPDILANLIKKILETPDIAGRVYIGSVETQGEEILSFLLSVHTTEGKVSERLLNGILNEFRGFTK